MYRNYKNIQKKNNNNLKKKSLHVKKDLILGEKNTHEKIKQKLLIHKETHRIQAYFC